MKRIAIILATMLAASPLAAQQTPLAAPGATEEQQLRLLLDRGEIGQLIVNYGLAFDRQDWALHRSVFAHEIEMDFSASIGDGLVTMRANEWADGAKPFFANLEGLPMGDDYRRHSDRYGTMMTKACAAIRQRKASLPSTEAPRCSATKPATARRTSSRGLPPTP